MKKVLQFGENVAGYDIPVLNEREIRAAAGILFLFLFASWQAIMHQGNFLLIKYFLIVFLADMAIRVFISPKYAPMLIIGRLIVRNQNPEYVGAVQKKFAWKIGVVLSGLMFILLNLVNSYSEIFGLSCMLCLVFLFFESAFGICLACKFYAWRYKEKAQYCPGEVCNINDKQDIQKTSNLQLIIVALFFIYIISSVFLFNDSFNNDPELLWDIIGLTQ